MTTARLEGLDEEPPSGTHRVDLMVLEGTQGVIKRRMAFVRREQRISGGFENVDKLVADSMSGDIGAGEPHIADAALEDGQATEQVEHPQDSASL